MSAKKNGALAEPIGDERERQAVEAIFRRMRLALTLIAQHGSTAMIPGDADLMSAEETRAYSRGAAAAFYTCARIAKAGLGT